MGVGLMKDFFRFIGLIAAIFLFAVLVDQIGPLKQLDYYLKDHPQPWIALTLGALALGCVLLIFTWISWGTLTGRPMTEAEAKEFMSRSAGSPSLNRVVRGKARGIKTPEGQVSFRQVKGAFRSGAWLSDPMMRVFCLGTVGLLLAVLGGFGFFIVTAPPTVKLICAGALLYAFGRTAWGFWQA